MVVVLLVSALRVKSGSEMSLITAFRVESGTTVVVLSGQRHSIGQQSSV